MAAGGIVERVDVLRDGEVCVVVGGIDAVADELCFQCAEEALRDALSQQSPFLLMLGTMPKRASSSR